MKSLLFTLVPLSLIPMLATTAISRPDLALGTSPGADGLPDLQGPAMTTSEVMLAQDNFPASGVLDPVDLNYNEVRFDGQKSPRFRPSTCRGTSCR